MTSRGTLVVLTSLLLPLTACGAGEREVAAGEAVRILDEPSVTRLADSGDLTVPLPVGELRLGWSDDPDLIASVTDEDDQELAAAEEGLDLVAVAWDVDPTALPSTGAAGLAALDVGSHELVLVSGGEETVISPESTRAIRGAAVAAVPDASDLALQVTYDGVTQVVGPGSERGPVPEQAASLHEGFPTAEATVACRPAASDAFCHTDATWLPWVSEQGWAPAGRLWPVVRLEARVTGTDTLTGSATLDGAEPLTTEDLAPADGGSSQLLVFPAAEPAPAELRVSFTGDGVELSGRARLSPSSPTGR